MCRLLDDLRRMAIQFCDEHDVTCCDRRIVNHCNFQCIYNSDSIISCYSEDKYECPDIEQVEKYVAYVAAHKIDTLINKYVAISHKARVMKGHSSIILQLCKNEFSDNVYVKEIILAPKGTNILQKKEVCKEEIEMDMFQPDLGEELDLPTSPQHMIVTLKLKSHLLSMITHAMIIFQLKIHALLVREIKLKWLFMRTLPIMKSMMHLCLLATLIVKLLMIMRIVL
jgi:hypothetical protein